MTNDKASRRLADYIVELRGLGTPNDLFVKAISDYIAEQRRANPDQTITLTPEAFEPEGPCDE